MTSFGNGFKELVKGTFIGRRRGAGIKRTLGIISSDGNSLERGIECVGDGQGGNGPVIVLAYRSALPVVYDGIV